MKMNLGAYNKSVCFNALKAGTGGWGGGSPTADSKHSKCSQLTWIVVGTVYLVQKGHPHSCMGPQHHSCQSALLHGINLLCGWPSCTDGCMPTTIQVNWLHLLCLLHGFSLLCKSPSIGCVWCMGSIYCVGDLFALSAVSPPSFKSIGCVLLHGDSLLCGSPAPFKSVGCVCSVNDLFALMSGPHHPPT